jgi:hypothetical protein
VDLQRGRLGIRKMAALHRVGVGTVQRIKSQLPPASSQVQR